jgi:hypothetical protein
VRGQMSWGRPKNVRRQQRRRLSFDQTKSS